MVPTMKPYYDDGKGIVIYHGDCREILPTLPKVDLVLTDPPYGIFKKPGGDGKMFGRATIYSKDQSASIWDKKPDAETIRMCVNAGEQFVIWGGNYMASSIGDCSGPLVWNKLTGANSYADGELAFSNVAGTMRIFTHQWCGAFKDSERGLKAMHPTQKPVQLMTWCISLADNPKIILDPYLGSGTTLIAAKDLGRKAIGIEIDEEYCDIAARRLSQEVLDLT